MRRDWASPVAMRAWSRKPTSRGRSIRHLGGGPPSLARRRASWSRPGFRRGQPVPTAAAASACAGGPVGLGRSPRYVLGVLPPAGRLALLPSSAPRPACCWQWRPSNIPAGKESICLQRFQCYGHRYEHESSYACRAPAGRPPSRGCLLLPLGCCHPHRTLMHDLIGAVHHANPTSPGATAHRR
jgi:hypothetical protein